MDPFSPVRLCRAKSPKGSEGSGSTCSWDDHLELGLGLLYTRCYTNTTKGPVLSSFAAENAEKQLSVKPVDP